MKKKAKLDSDAELEEESMELDNKKDHEGRDQDGGASGAPSAAASQIVTAT